LRELRGKRFWPRLVVVQTEDKQACSNLQYKQVYSGARHAGKIFLLLFNARGECKNKPLSNQLVICDTANESY